VARLLGENIDQGENFPLPEKREPGTARAVRAVSDSSGKEQRVGHALLHISRVMTIQ
jgi:hypothetical protein